MATSTSRILLNQASENPGQDKSLRLRGVLTDSDVKSDDEFHPVPATPPELIKQGHLTAVSIFSYYDS
jgi:hypothetical protein